MTALLKSTWRAAGILLAFALVGTAVLAYTFDKTKAPIERAEQQAKLALITQIVPRDAFDNDIVNDTAAIAATRAAPR